ncbi:hypothetical protein [Methylomagnum sp.]
MTRAPRLALCLLLVLMQLLAPWVHAHTGAETGGFMHLPGLEAFVDSEEGYATARLARDGLDVIVGVQAGTWNPSDPAEFIPDSQNQPHFPSPGPLSATAPPVGGVVAAAALQPLFRLPHFRPHSRAPPPRLT